ncbi:LOW QUALITY PROTEIN: solute carrier family 2 member 11, like [Salvelinus alpinus]
MILSTTLSKKRCLLLNNLFVIGGAVMMLLSKTAMSFEMIMVRHFLYGVNAGCEEWWFVSVATFVSMGKFSGQLLGISELLGTEDRWQWLLGFSGAAALLPATLPLLPESPRYLLLDRGDHQGCEKAIRRLLGSRDHSVEGEMLVEHASMIGVRSHTVLDLDQAVRWQLLTVLVTFNAEKLDYYCLLSGVFGWYNMSETRNLTMMEITGEIHRMHPNRGSSGEG